jgi:hypothetical protein
MFPMHPIHETTCRLAGTAAPAILRVGDGKVVIRTARATISYPAREIRRVVITDEGRGAHDYHLSVDTVDRLGAAGLWFGTDKAGAERVQAWIEAEMARPADAGGGAAMPETWRDLGYAVLFGALLYVGGNAANGPLSTVGDTVVARMPMPRWGVAVCAALAAFLAYVVHRQDMARWVAGWLADERPASSRPWVPGMCLGGLLLACGLWLIFAPDGNAVVKLAGLGLVGWFLRLGLAHDGYRQGGGAAYVGPFPFTRAQLLAFLVVLALAAYIAASLALG